MVTIKTVSSVKTNQNNPKTVFCPTKSFDNFSENILEIQTRYVYDLMKTSEILKLKLSWYEIRL